MKKNLLTLLICALAHFSYAQVNTFSTALDRSMRDSFVDVEQTTDGGYITIGTTTGYAGVSYEHAVLVKFNHLGDTLWTKIHGGPGHVGGSAVKQTLDGGYFIGGMGANVLKRAYAAKLDAAGNILWRKEFGKGGGADMFNSVLQNADGTYMALGSSRKDTTTFFYLVKLNAMGDSLWTKTYATGLGKDHYGAELVKTTDGGYLITGQVQDDSSHDNAYIIKVNSIGNQQWAKLYPQTNGLTGIQTVDGGYIIGGLFNSGTGYLQRSALLKLDTAGDVVWTKSYPGVGINSVIQTPDGGFAFTGSVYGDSIISFQVHFEDLMAGKTDAAGNLRFIQYFSDTLDDVGLKIIQASDGGFVVAGLNAWNFSPGIGPVPLGGPSRALLLKINFTSQHAVLGVEKKMGSEAPFRLYPNPATSHLTIRLTDKTLKSDALQVRITNALGAEVLNKNVHGTEILLNRGTLKSGFYLVHLTDSETGKIKATRKLILK